MKTQEQLVSLQAADEQALFDHAFRGKPLDPEVRRRAKEQAEKITSRLQQLHGQMDLAVPLLRETRDE